MSGQINLIQALRGLAISLVILYHCSFVFHGGFIGVDVFFVISGFLITKSVLTSLEMGQHGLELILRFYNRRILRLFPALSVTILATTSLSLLVFSPYGEIEQLLMSALAGILFFANGRFFLLNDYTSLTTDPFRHLWSLGVEEQFYLVFPLLIAVVGRIASKDHLRRVLLIGSFLVITLSFVLSLFLSYGFRLLPLPERFAFYSPVTRAWQLGAGVVIGLCQVSPVTSKTKTRLWTLGAVIGLGLIVISGVNLNQYTNYPGLVGGLPVLGAGLILIGALKSEQLGAMKFGILSHLGDMSYSLYLVHWPLLVILQRAFSDTAIISLASIPMSIILARLQYRLVERHSTSGHLSAKK